MASESGDVYLVLGKTGWIGGKLIELLTVQGKKFHLAESRTYDRESLIKEFDLYKPTHVLNAAGFRLQFHPFILNSFTGVTGRPNVDWCEDHKQETIRTNVIGCLNVADICASRGIHHLLYATGCIFEYDSEHVIGGKGFLETDTPNFHGSFYSHTKV